MRELLTLMPAVVGMLETAGVSGVYGYAPSALDCACPVVVCNEEYESTDLLEDCEYGRVTLDVIAVRETKDEALQIISSCVLALHRADWERWSNDRINIRGISVHGLPARMEDDNSGRVRYKARVCLDVCISHE